MDLVAETEITIWSIIKIAVIIFTLMYIIFSFVVIRQVKLMTDTLELGHENTIKAMAVAHFAFAVVVFIFALVIL